MQVQAVVDEYLPQIKAVEGVTGVQRVVCGGCLDYKLIISLAADKYENLGRAGLEEGFLKRVSAISGVDTVETQTFTISPL